MKWIAAQADIGAFEPHGVRMGLRQGKREIIVNSRHDFPGNSMWNNAHGPMRAAQMGWRDHILTCGHKHTSGYGQVKDPATGLISHCIRVAAYKIIDDYPNNLLGRLVTSPSASLTGGKRWMHMAGRASKARASMP